MNKFLTRPILTTHSGKYVDIYAPDVDSIVIDDIAHALSNLCRYGGHSDIFYSVADHCVNMHDYFMERDQPINAYVALMHDATEAYLCDIPRPIKPFITGYQEIEDNLQKVIFEKFKVPKMNDAVKKLDHNIIYNEVEEVNMIQPEWKSLYQDLEVPIFVSPSTSLAKAAFLECYYNCVEQLGLK